MTERLIQLLEREANGLDVPPPATSAVLRQGRGMRRRRAAVAGATGAVAAVVVAGSVFALSGGGDGSDAAPDAASAPAAEGAVYAVGNRVYIDNGARSATIDDKAVKSLYYTSAGVLVRHGNNPYSDGGGPQRFSVVAPDGSVSRVSVQTEDTVHATDPDEPYLVYGQAVGSELVVFVHDVTTDEQVARIPVAPTREGWFPISYADGTVYVQDGYDGARFAVDWRAGDVTETDTFDHGLDVAGGHALVPAGGGDQEIVDVATGDVVLEIPAGENDWVSLSPDGRYVQVVVEDFMSQNPAPPVAEIYDIEAGTQVTLDGSSWGWTPDGKAFRLTDRGALTVCDPGTGDCTESRVEAPAGPDIVLGGTIRES